MNNLNVNVLSDTWTYQTALRHSFSNLQNLYDDEAESSDSIDEKGEEVIKFVEQLINQSNLDLLGRLEKAVSEFQEYDGFLTKAVEIKHVTRERELLEKGE